MDKAARKTSPMHKIVRVDISVQESYDNFLNRFEEAVPMVSRERLTELVERKAPWSEVAADVKVLAPHDFLLYWKLDLSVVMSLAGNKRRATKYLMGNHVIAETMYRHDPAVALYVPLGCAIYEAEGETRFTTEKPSAVLSSLRQPEIARVGLDLDRKLAGLLTALGIEVPGVLSSSGASA